MNRQQLIDKVTAEIALEKRISDYQVTTYDVCLRLADMVVKNCYIPDVCESLPEEIEKWYAKETNRIVEEFDDYDKHICNVVLKWQQQVNSVDLADVGSSLRELADKYEMDALKRYETGEHALSHLHMAAQARYGFEDGWKAAKNK